MAKKVRRLYVNFRPESYNLELELDPKESHFKGRVVIEGLKIGRPSKRLTFHQKNLKINQVGVSYLSQKGQKKLVASRHVKHPRFHEVRLHFDQLIYAGRYRVEIDYEGRINSQLHGLYRCGYAHGSKTKEVLCTQLESHYARELMPCIDEPEAKSVFNLTLITPASMPVVIANTEAAESTKKGQLVTTKFMPTPKMSSYLLAFVVGDLKYLEAKTATGVVVRAYAQPALYKNGQFGLDCAVKILDFYRDYFAIDYPLSKCDLIALPEFSSGAMENWGCITFREQSLLVDPLTTSLETKQYVADVIAHELTHQWFGNLVTMRWWNDLWLNESFASWMSYLAVDHLFPEWQIWSQFIVDEQAPGLMLDSLENTHPIEVVVNNPDEIRTIFDNISYQKGAAILTMLHDYVGAEVFRDGIRHYLSQNAYGNTDTSDLWRAIEKASSQPIEQFASRWTTTSGYPLLKATYTQDTLHLEQHRFYLNPLAQKETGLWPVPLFSGIDFGRNDPLKHRSLNTGFQTLPASFLLNKGRRGFYRVVYDDQTVMSILDDDFMTHISELDRMGLIADAFEAAKAGYLSTISCLKMLERYFQEDRYLVWLVISANLASLRNAMDDEGLRELTKPFIGQLIAGQLDHLGLKAKKSDSHFDSLLRPIIMSLAARIDQPEVVAYCQKLFSLSQTKPIDPDLSGIVYTTVARHGDKTDFNKLLKKHRETSSSEDRIKLASALTSFKQPELIDQALSLIKSKEVKLQDVVYWLIYSFANHYSRDASWRWLKDNWSWVSDSMAEDLSFYRMPFYVARNYSSLDFLKEFEEFFNQKLSDSLDRPRQQAIETIQWQAEWRVRDLKAVRDYFAQWPKA